MDSNRQYRVNSNDSIHLLLDDLMSTPVVSTEVTQRIWIDMVKPHQTFFFRPMIQELRSRGNSVYVTTAESPEVTRLLDDLAISYTAIGNHVRTWPTRSVTDVFKRSAQLKKYARYRKFDLALVFNSPSLALAAKVLHIPAMVFMDYEYEPLNQLMLRLSDTLVVPTFFPDEFLLKCRASGKTIKYDGFKEQVYLSDFRPQEDFLRTLKIDDNRIIVTARAPHGTQLYQRFANSFFSKLVSYLLQDDKVTVLAIPHSEEQERLFASIHEPNLIVVAQQLDRRNLLYHSDILVSAGGTMSHEAAVLGIPTYTLFTDKIGAVDRHLINLGRITPIESIDDIKKIQLVKTPHRDILTNHRLTGELVHHILKDGG